MLWSLFSLSHAAVLAVGAGQPYPRIELAVAAAQPGDVVEIHPGIYAEEVLISGTTLDIVGVGSPVLEGPGTLLTVEDADVRMVGLVLRPAGRGIWVERSELTLEDSVVEDNRNAVSGAAIYGTTFSDVVVRRSVFRGNGRGVVGFRAVYGGSIYVEFGGLTVEDCSFVDGLAGYGGAIAGGEAAALVVSGTRFEGNAATADGGAVWADADGWVTVLYSAFVSNEAGENGGALYARGRSVTVADASFLDAVAGSDGGAIYSSATMRDDLRRNTFEGCSATDGGAVYLVGGADAELHDNRFCRTTATEDGGGVFSFSATDWTNNVWIETTAGQRGGAAWIDPCFGCAFGAVRFNDFLGASAPSGAALWLESERIEVEDNLIAWTTGGAAVGLGGRAPRHGWQAWYQNGGGDTNGFSPSGSDVFGVPMLFGYPADRSCAASVVRALTSPLRDAGDPAVLDPDGSRADIGSIGGPAGAGWTDEDGDGYAAVYDCDDADAGVSPGAAETCDDRDQDCDRVVDDVSAFPVYYLDQDGDGFGDAPVQGTSCAPPPGASAAAGDCDDADGAAHPGHPEVCDGRDEDCDGAVDDVAPEDAPAWYADGDGDGHGAGPAVMACVAPAGHVASGDDCDDALAAVAPGAPERCNGVDDDCDGDVDGAASVDAPTWYADADADGFGDPLAPTIAACAQPAAAAANAADCDDGDADAWPGAPESCEATADQNCDGVLPDADADQDGSPACADCDDADPTAYPGAPDVDPYDDRIQDCVGTWEHDADHDGYAAPSGRGEDCDDADNTVFPGAPESPTDTVDRDCDGIVPPGAPEERRGCDHGRGRASVAWGVVLVLLRRRGGACGSGPGRERALSA